MDKNKKQKPLAKAIKIGDGYMINLANFYFKVTPVETGHVTNPASEIETMKFEDAVNFMIDSLNDRIDSLESKIKALDTIVRTAIDKADNDDTPLDHLSTPENP